MAPGSGPEGGPPCASRPSLRRDGANQSCNHTGAERHCQQPGQAQALALYRKHPAAAGLRWWSTWEARWANVTLFDRAAALLRLVSVDELTLEHAAVADAAELFGLRVM